MLTCVYAKLEQLWYTLVKTYLLLYGVTRGCVQNVCVCMLKHKAKTDVRVLVNYL